MSIPLQNHYSRIGSVGILCFASARHITVVSYSVGPFLYFPTPHARLTSPVFLLSSPSDSLKKELAKVDLYTWWTSNDRRMVRFSSICILWYLAAVHSTYTLYLYLPVFRVNRISVLLCSSLSLVLKCCCCNSSSRDAFEKFRFRPVIFLFWEE